jgi:hypothetical protein
MEDTKILFLKAGLPDPQKAADFLKVDRSTVSRWRTGATQLPYHVAQLLHIMAGNPPEEAKQKWFKGWKFNGDLFISPEGDKYTEGDIRALRIMQSEIICLKAEIRRLRSDNDDLAAKLANLQEPDKLPDNVVRFPGRHRAG